MEESQRVRELIENASWVSFRVLTGLVGLVALVYVAVHVVPKLFSPQSIPLLLWVCVVTPHAGWGGLVYACWIRSGRITNAALAFVLALGVCGMAVSFLTLAFLRALSLEWILPWIVLLTGSWILNGLGIVWIVHKVRRIVAASNTNAADAER